jgi:hypothetical protein
MLPLGVGRHGRRGRDALFDFLNDENFQFRDAVTSKSTGLVGPARYPRGISSTPSTQTDPAHRSSSPVTMAIRRATNVQERSLDSFENMHEPREQWIMINSTALVIRRRLRVVDLEETLQEVRHRI